LASHSGPIGSAVRDATSAAVQGDDDVPGMGPDVVVNAEAAPVCDGASGVRPLGLPAEGAVCPLASHGGPIGSAVGDAPSAAVPGDDDIPGMGPDVVIAAEVAPVCDGASGVRPLGLSAEGAVRPLASHGRPIGLAVGDAPSAAVPGDDDVTGMGPDVVVAAEAAPVCVGASGDRPVGFSAEGRIGEPCRIVVPAAVQMGWVESMSHFCFVTETARDITQHCVDNKIAFPHDPIEESMTMVDVPLRGRTWSPTKLLQVYVDDFCYAATQSENG